MSSLWRPASRRRAALAGSLASQYPDLLRPRQVPNATRQFVVCDESPPEERIANVCLLPRLGSSWLYFVDESGSLQLPGGKKRAGETHRETVERELRGAVGAQLESIRLIGHWALRARAAKSGTTHLAHGESFDVVASGHVQLVGSPARAAEGDQTLEVRVAPLPRVVASFVADGQRDVADLYRLASRLSG
jgi:8-oxo-dGTP pyrophosphatase MutT (NUDIX family)